jgi:hypothetical protein
LEIDFN